MIWLIWRRQRTALLLLATLTPLAVAALCWIRLASAARFGARGVPDACFAEGTPQCRMLAQQLLTRDDAFGGLWGLGHSFLLVLPLLLGLIAGAGLFSRDIENGTSVFVLAQGTSWQRWWVSGLLVTGLPALVAAAVIGALTRWGFSPLDLITYPFSLLETPVFEISGLAPVGYALLAFCVAAASGILTRSALGAIVIAVPVYGVVMTVLAIGLRPIYRSPETLPISSEADMDDAYGRLQDVRS
jgi:hypothetical protein